MAGRGGFSNRLGFVLAAAGSAVGLGNIWKFPFEVGAGGGAAFVVMYLLFCFLLCFPVMVTEIAIGRKTQLNPVGAFKALGYKRWSIVGLLGVISGLLILSFYNVVAGWAFGYVIEMVMGNFDVGNQFSDYIKDVIKTGAYAVVFMGTTALIVSRGVSGGIEKAAKLLMPALIIIIIGLMLYALTLPNSFNGLKFYLIPDFSEINLSVIYKALGQAFFSLSLGMGALITYGSYMGKKDNIVSSAALITLMDVGIAFIAGLMMFPLVAYYAGTIGTDIQSVPSGPGLIFQTLPVAFESLGPVGGVAIGSVFFLLLSFAALTSTVSLLEVPVAYVVDELKVRRSRAVWGTALVVFVIGIPSLLSNGAVESLSNFITYYNADKATSFMTFVENIASDSFLPLGGLLIVTFAAYVWKKENLDQEISLGADNYMNSAMRKYLSFAISYLCPLILGVIFVLTVLSKFFGINVVN